MLCTPNGGRSFHKAMVRAVRPSRGLLAGKRAHVRRTHVCVRLCTYTGSSAGELAGVGTFDTSNLFEYVAIFSNGNNSLVRAAVVAPMAGWVISICSCSSVSQGVLCPHASTPTRPDIARASERLNAAFPSWHYSSCCTVVPSAPRRRPWQATLSARPAYSSWRSTSLTKWLPTSPSAARWTKHWPHGWVRASQLYGLVVPPSLACK